MTTIRSIRIKVCGITNLEDALAAADLGADVLGFVFHPESPRSVEPETARKIILELPPFIKTAGVFVNRPIKEVEKTAAHVGLDLVQFHGDEKPEACKTTLAAYKALRVRRMEDISVLADFPCETFLLDAYTEKAYGGTGQTFNWEIAIEAKRYGRIILSGGLTPANVEEAIRYVEPYAVDVSSGVEKSKGRKDHKLLAEFIQRARKALLPV